MADKDTPEDALPPQDHGGGRPDGPRSEGSQAARAFPTHQPEGEGEAAPADPAPADPAPEATQPEIGAVSEPETRTVEPPETPEPAPQHPPSVEAPIEAPPSTLEALSITPETEHDTSFASVADGLFRPNAEHCSDTHLITTGRPFRSSLPPPTAAAAQAVEPLPAPAPSPADVWKHRLLLGLRYGAYGAAAYLLLVLALIVLFRFVNPPGSMLMLTKLLGGTAIDRTWVPLQSISPALVRAVIVSEDSRFCEHRGIDLQAMRLALEDARRGSPRGASTISMQVSKNMFLWNAKSYLRKVIEIPLTLVLETVWPKERIVEVYLNIAEWAPGVFGAEAAARHHFGKSAARLSAREAALMAAALPNPEVRVAGKPGPRHSRMARVIQTRVGAFGSVARCVVGRSQTANVPAPSQAPAAAEKTPARSTEPTKAQPAGAKSPASAKTRPDDWGTTLRFGPIAGN